MVLLIDNYDSFTYNLAQLLMRLGEEVTVVRNDEVTLEEAEALDFDKLVISPGPGRPETAGIRSTSSGRFAGRKPILGVCLGHQAIAAAFGARIVRAKRIMHGKADTITHDGKTLFSDAPNPLRVIRYHSLAHRPGEPERRLRGKRDFLRRGNHGHTPPRSTGSRACSSIRSPSAPRRASALCATSSRASAKSLRSNPC